MEQNIGINDIGGTTDNSENVLPASVKARLFARQNTILIRQIDSLKKSESRLQKINDQLLQQTNRDEEIADRLRQRIDELTAHNEELTEIATARVGVHAVLKIQRRQENQQALQRQIQSLKAQNRNLKEHLSTLID